MSYGVVARVACDERNFLDGCEMRCVADAGHLDDRQGHQFEFIEQPAYNKPERLDSGTYRALARARGLGGWQT